MRIILSDPAKSGLEGGVWIDGYDYQKKEKNIAITKNKTPLFLSMQSIIAQLLDPVIATIFDVILNI